VHWIDWIIVVVPTLFVLGIAIYCKKYIRGIADYLAAGRVAGRYVMAVGTMEASLSVITLVSLCEREYQAGLGLGLWNRLIFPITIFMSLTGYCVYRFRETQCMSIGQFLEIRYNRPFRIIAGFVRTLAEMLVNAIGPAVAARFFIYFAGLPFKFHVLGLEVSTFAVVMVIVLSLALVVIWPGGRVSLLVTDAIQGLMAYPIFVIFTVFVLGEISWSNDVVPIMMDRAPGESFLEPTDISSLRDFNLFALFVTIVGQILNRASWLGNDVSSAGRTAHEQKMAGVLGSWRDGFSYLMMALLALFMITVMLGNRFNSEARDIRVALVTSAARETVKDDSVRNNIISDITAIPPIEHIIGKDEPYSRKSNPDVTYLNAVQKHLEVTPDGNTTFQKLRTLYYQMMAPTVLRKELPVGIMGLFILLMIMLMLSTDDSRIFNSSSTLIQDVIMPFRKKPFKPKTHLLWLRIMSVLVCIFFLVVSLFFSQMDFIQMFIQITAALWLGAAGPIMVGGLYTRFGTTTGAFCALIFGSGTSLTGIILQRNWGNHIYPWLVETGNIKYVNGLFEKVTGLFGPYIVWEMNKAKFPINSYEIYFIAILLGVSAYVIGSLLTYREPFNLEKLLHRGNYSKEKSRPSSPWTWSNVYSKLIGITDEYSKGDKIIAWSVFGYSIVIQFLIAFVGVLVWNIISPWPAEWWSTYFFITMIVFSIIVGSISTVWFMVGGFMDVRRLFRDLGRRINDPLDDGWVVGHTSLADAESIGSEEEKNEAIKEEEDVMPGH